MVAEVLSLIIKRDASTELISGFSPSPQGTIINYLQFADDLIIFTDDNTEQIPNLKNILFAFELISGLRVNFKKSGVVPVGETQNARACVNCSCVKFPINNLGIPLGSKSNATSIWEVILQRFQKKKIKWMAKKIHF
ncbi:uncharacterized protein LOC113351486 [Papaver somniferum]|uniref:uncharacterized protein LOC113351486 n=1 Tax=Papaver somniferum TaxID=3469 RepID=UPI000E6FF66D|nr:uncharacterized protein LOC113351486 [Papaver somniferum]